MSSGTVTAPGTTSAPQEKPHLSDRARSERRLAFWLVGPAVVVMIAVLAYPLVDTVILSLQRADLRFPEANKFIGLANFGHVLSAPVFWQDLWHTVIITVVSVSIQFVLGMLLAFQRTRSLRRSTRTTLPLWPLPELFDSRQRNYRRAIRPPWASWTAPARTRTPSGSGMRNLLSGS